MESHLLSSRAQVALRRVPLFRHYDDAELQAVLAMSCSDTLGADEPLFEEGTPCRAFYLVEEGLIELSRRTPNGGRQVIEFIGEGQTFAEAAMFSGQGYPVSAKALVDSRLVSINAYRFMRLLQQRPAMTWGMLADLSMRLHRLVGDRAVAGLKHAEQKVAAFMLENLEEDSPNGRVLGLPYRRRDLANRLNLSVETLCRIIGAFRNRGWVETEDASGVYVRDIEALRRLLED